MDKNTVIGFLLIGVVLFAFSWFNRPSPEQVAAQKQRDSLARVEQAAQAAQQQAAATGTDQTATAALFVEGESDSARTARLENAYGAFAGSVSGEETFTVLQNDLVELKISNKGGRVAYARLKEYEAYDGSPLVLFEPESSSFDITLVTANNRVINTSEMYFTPMRQDSGSLVMRLNAADGAYLDFGYSLKPGSYLAEFRIVGSGLNGVLAPPF